jgi:hypothetical protein
MKSGSCNYNFFLDVLAIQDMKLDTRLSKFLSDIVQKVFEILLKRANFLFIYFMFIKQLPWWIRMKMISSFIPARHLYSQAKNCEETGEEVLSYSSLKNRLLKKMKTQSKVNPKKANAKQVCYPCNSSFVFHSIFLILCIYFFCVVLSRPETRPGRMTAAARL